MANLKIKRTKGQTELLIKRLYLPFKISSDCPKCGETYVRDLKDDYLSYPITGPIEVDFNCWLDEDCDHEWLEEVLLDVTITKKEST